MNASESRASRRGLHSVVALCVSAGIGAAASSPSVTDLSRDFDERVSLTPVCAGVFTRFKKQWALFKQSPPGKRFVAWHERSRKASVGQGGGWRILRITGALVCFVFAILGSLMPGVPGFVFLFIGAALLASESRKIARWLDWMDIKVRDRLPARRHS